MAPGFVSLAQCARLLRTREVSSVALTTALLERIARLDGGLDSFLRVTGWTISECRTLLAKFALGANDVLRPNAGLSPGERTRAVLALFTISGVNCLVLDEPTNHLDLPAIEQLEQALETFAGTLLLVTHDRALLAEVVTTREIRIEHGLIASDRPTASVS